ncbi:hypothetical protein EES46_31630 [Streptomyces sp. ADI98-10]|nr:hypothetical protein EES46_31630 [Streptomyces sp. ADI98-10]
MAAYERGAGTSEIASADQKLHISFYLLRTDVRNAFADRPASHDRGDNCLRFRDPQKIDFTPVRDLRRATAATRGTAC